MDSRVATDFSKLPSHCLVTRFLNQLNSSQCYSCIATSFCKTEMVEISCPYHPCALCPVPRCLPARRFKRSREAMQLATTSRGHGLPGLPRWFRFGASNSASGANLKADSACHGANRHSKHDETCHNMSYRKPS